MNKAGKFIKKLLRRVGEEYYKIIWFYQLGWYCELATLKRFESWRFEPLVGANPANAPNIRFRISFNYGTWPIHIINPVDKTKL